MSDSDDARLQGGIGEVITSSVTGFVAQCWKHSDEDGSLPAKPRFGSYLTVDCSETGIQIYAVLYDVITGPPDNVHAPFAFGLTRERLRVEQPQIFSLLRTELQAATIGFKESGVIYQHLPPFPPDVHDFVYQSQPAEIMELTQNFEFLRHLAAVTSVPSDELLAAAVREAYRARDEDYEFLVAAGQALSTLLRTDYDRLMCVLQKIRPHTLSKVPPTADGPLARQSN